MDRTLLHLLSGERRENAVIGEWMVVVRMSGDASPLTGAHMPFSPYCVV
jgi:hypothetical protein